MLYQETAKPTTKFNWNATKLEHAGTVTTQPSLLLILKVCASSSATARELLQPKWLKSWTFTVNPYTSLHPQPDTLQGVVGLLVLLTLSLDATCSRTRFRFTSVNSNWRTTESRHSTAYSICHKIFGQSTGACAEGTWPSFQCENASGANGSGRLVQIREYQECIIGNFWSPGVGTGGQNETTASLLNSTIPRL